MDDFATPILLSLKIDGGFQDQLAIKIRQMISGNESFYHGNIEEYNLPIQDSSPLIRRLFLSILEERGQRDM